MFVALSRFQRGPVELTVGVAFERRFRIYAINRRGLVFDTRFAPATAGSVNGVIVYLLLDGALRWDDGTVFEGPSLFIMRERDFEGSGGVRAHAFRSWGTPFQTLELRIAANECAVAFAHDDVDTDTAGAGTGGGRPYALPLEERDSIVSAGRLYLHACHRGKNGSDSAVVDLATSYLGKLRDRGVLATDLGLTITRDEGVRGILWEALRPAIESFGGAKQDIVTARAGAVGWNSRRIQRELARMTIAFGVGWIGSWRDVALRYRVRVAVLLLSNPTLSVSEIADAVGYSSVEAFAHALESCGLPPASEIRRALLADLLP